MDAISVALELVAFQSLTGRLQTCLQGLARPVRQMFQSLTGRLQTCVECGVIRLVEWFQSLTGRLQTE